MMMRSAFASSIGLIVAELVTNSFKYAYMDGQSGIVDVSLQKSDNGWSLEVADNGAGLPPGFDVTQSKGVGMRVVNALVSRMNAKLRTNSNPGRTSFRIEIQQTPV